MSRHEFQAHKQAQPGTGPYTNQPGTSAGWAAAGTRPDLVRGLRGQPNVLLGLVPYCTAIRDAVQLCEVPDPIWRLNVATRAVLLMALRHWSEETTE
jgi:hypothetical protein